MIRIIKLRSPAALLAVNPKIKYKNINNSGKVGEKSVSISFLVPPFFRVFCFRGVSSICFLFVLKVFLFLYRKCFCFSFTKGFSKNNFFFDFSFIFC